MPAAFSFNPKAEALSDATLRGYLRHGQATELWTQVVDPRHALEFSRIARELGRNEPVKAVNKTTLERLKQPGALYYPGPDIGEHAWRRAAHGHGAWSLCGVTHTTSSIRAMEAITSWLTAPLQPWDAVICTSNAVRDNVRRVLQAQADYLQGRLGIQRVVLPQLPVIPLGVHASDFEFDEGQRAAARQALGVDENTLVVLYVGRLSFHAKAHPLAMYQALEQAAQTLVEGKKVVLVECGWHANDFIERAYAEAAQQACPSVRVLTLDGREVSQRQTAWAGADIFCSLSDNIQETFGIVPIEAMAAGLPVLVSDWDGYRDTVRDGIDGFRVPTWMPGPGHGEELAQRHALEVDSYDMYCGHASSLVAVDIQAAARGFEALFASAELRQRLGANGRQRVKALFDWAVIIPRYEALWAQLGELRHEQAASLQQAKPVWPARMDPFESFASYPTARLNANTPLVRVDADLQLAVTRLRAMKALAMVDYAKLVIPELRECELILEEAGEPVEAGVLVGIFDEKRRPFMFRALAWMLKIGVLRIA